MNRRRLWSLRLALGTWLFVRTSLVFAEPQAEQAVQASSVPGTAGPKAASAAEAEALLQRGIELRKVGDDRAALALFERAFALGGSARALAQWALAEQALGLWLDADEHLEQALVEKTDPWISAHRATLEAALQEITSQLGALELSCNVVGAEVRVDGRVLGRTPLNGPVKLVAGANVIQVASQGYFDVVRSVNVDAGQLSRLNVILTSRPASPPGAEAVGPSSGASSAANAVGDAARPEVSLTEENGGSPPRDILLYTTLGLAALGTSVGVTGYVMREVNVGQYNDDRRCSLRMGISRSDECPSQVAAFRRGEVLAIAGFSSAVVFGLVGSYLWWDRASSARETSFGCMLGPAMAGCHGSF